MFSSKEKERILFHVLVLGVPQEVTQTKTKQIQGGAVLILLLPNPRVVHISFVWTVSLTLWLSSCRKEELTDELLR